LTGRGPLFQEFIKKPKKFRHSLRLVLRTFSRFPGNPSRRTQACVTSFITNVHHSWRGLGNQQGKVVWISFFVGRLGGKYEAKE
jgi:hypothetical protein